MSFKTLKKMVVLDPALIAAGGHHTGFAVMAAKSLFESKVSLDLEFVCSHCIDESVKAELEMYGCRLRPEFFINFYEIFGEDNRIAESQSYILQAAKEYARVICDTKNCEDEAGLVFFHPCLSWEHALALSLALKFTENVSSSTHIVCAMFNPGMSYTGKTLEPTSKLNFGIAFRALLSISNVKLFASDFELGKKYGELLRKSAPFPIHPCYLADWPRLIRVAKEEVSNVRKSSTVRILLYLGDAKVDKGFLQLPDLIRRLLNDNENRFELTVQCNCPWPNEEIDGVYAQLVKLSLSDRRFSLLRGFLSDNEMHSLLRQSDLLVLNYCAQSYREKSSGVLWLAAWHKVPVCLLGENWLGREAERLGMEYRRFSKDHITMKKLISFYRLVSRKNSTSSIEYTRLIYKPLLEWIDSQVAQR